MDFVKYMLTGSDLKMNAVGCDTECVVNRHQCCVCLQVLS
jgi:hypothetical protein